jgi:hypothetical protein
MSTINRLGLPKILLRCLGGTNAIESPYSRVREKTGGGAMARRPCAGPRRCYYRLRNGCAELILEFSNWALVSVSYEDIQASRHQ